MQKDIRIWYQMREKCISFHKNKRVSMLDFQNFHHYTLLYPYPTIKIGEKAKNTSINVS